MTHQHGHCENLDKSYDDDDDDGDDDDDDTNNNTCYKSSDTRFSL